LQKCLSHRQVARSSGPPGFSTAVRSRRILLVRKIVEDETVISDIGFKDLSHRALGPGTDGRGKRTGRKDLGARLGREG